ncbi:hypothetical protein BCR34DRAFT_89272 [Clohesyomyces aquaticus]|uniref:Uncharacterized protein n=1 Tax=Clohesyomyces aquaticus TaxID=1231657 RepID=A0A1Y1YWW6_9PLEO|nr:hypothetical protein BCR34DRAFT_89272 [Clohesyomyces aquaticus]
MSDLWDHSGPGSLQLIETSWYSILVCLSSVVMYIQVPVISDRLLRYVALSLKFASLGKLQGNMEENRDLSESASILDGLSFSCDGWVAIKRSVITSSALWFQALGCRSSLWHAGRSRDEVETIRQRQRLLWETRLQQKLASVLGMLQESAEHDQGFISTADDSIAGEVGQSAGE